MPSSSKVAVLVDFGAKHEASFTESGYKKESGEKVLLNFLFLIPILISIFQFYRHIITFEAEFCIFRISGFSPDSCILPLNLRSLLDFPPYQPNKK